MGKYEIRTEGVSEAIEAATLDEARELARAWLREGYFGEREATTWVKGYLSWTDEDGDDVDERVRVAIDPPAPRCIDGSRGSHTWESTIELVGGIKENPGVWGHGGGVVIHEACARCGSKRVTDTWAQDPETGEQGLTSIAYQERAYDLADLEACS